LQNFAVEAVQLLDAKDESVHGRCLVETAVANAKTVTLTLGQRQAPDPLATPVANMTPDPTREIVELLRLAASGRPFVAIKWFRIRSF
jgi:hypothetical protein